MKRVKVLAELPAVQVVVVAATKRLLLLFGCLWHQLLVAAVLPEDRADMLFHSYSGGGMEITGPSILVRKGIKEKVSVYAHYYVDMVSSASIDVLSNASKYKEKRTEKGFGADLLANKALLSTSYTTSQEKDYFARTANFSVSQDFFGDLTTVSMGYTRGWNDISQTADPTFQREAVQQRYQLGVAQILTKSLIFNASLEAITDEGYLNNPYRVVRYLNGGTVLKTSEVYPHTRTSNALSFRAKYYLPYRAALGGEFRYFQDTWGIRANDFQASYTHPFKDDLVFDLRFRLYTQTRADFYSDLFPRANFQNFLARDKELSTFDSYVFGFGVAYNFYQDQAGMLNRASVNVQYDYFNFDYKDFRNELESQSGSAVAGEESYYGFDAHVIRLYLSIWF